MHCRKRATVDANDTLEATQVKRALFYVFGYFYLVKQRYRCLLSSNVNHFTPNYIEFKENKFKKVFASSKVFFRHISTIQKWAGMSLFSGRSTGLLDNLFPNAIFNVLSMFSRMIRALNVVVAVACYEILSFSRLLVIRSVSGMLLGIVSEWRFIRFDKQFKIQLKINSNQTWN